MLILVSGASGFVGRALCAELLQRGQRVRAAFRHCRVVSLTVDNVESCEVGLIDATTDWQTALSGCNTVVHLAAKVHVMRDKLDDALAEFRVVNSAGTMNLARQAAAAGVGRFIYLSTIKVNGEQTTPLSKNACSQGRTKIQGVREIFRENDPPFPDDAYAVSKCEAEDGLRSIARETGMEVVIIRPPLVYGPGVKANFLAMMNWLRKGIPLPLGAIHNNRSLVALDNLVDLIVTCLDHPAAANQTFFVADGEDLSTTELLRRLGRHMGKPARLIPVPQQIVEAGLKIVGRGDLARRLCGSLQVDISKARNLLGWSPPVSVDEALKLTADYFLESHSR